MCLQLKNYIFETLSQALIKACGCLILQKSNVCSSSIDSFCAVKTSCVSHCDYCVVIVNLYNSAVEFNVQGINR